MPDCRFFLLGRFSAVAGERPLDLPAGPARTLLKVLLAAGSAREADLGRWLSPPRPGARPVESGAKEPGPVQPGEGDAVGAAVAALDAALSTLCPGARVERVPGSVRLTLPGETWVDVAALQAWAQAGARREADGDWRGALVAYQEAECLYLGDLLEEEGPAEWAVAARLEARRQYTAVLEAMARCWRALGEPGYAEGFAAKARAMAPGA